MVNKRGRPLGGSDARERLLLAAQKHLDAGDLSETSSRTLAVEAGVSHTLVNYHFGGRDRLLTAAIALRVAPHEVVAASTDSGGEIDLGLLTELFVRIWEDPARGPSLEALAREAAAGSARSGAIVEYIQGAVIGQLTASFGAEKARRAAIVVVGVIFARYVLRVPALATLTPRQVIGTMRSMLPRPSG
ncbi:TetR/AcrR family transcriptional regulator [Microbacterium karelineae]|uniref:TetR/AcrR family transcriptional regulator n=1 Tax=Microbacterium karelineae TaxID=2654283 RepID=UPI0012EAA455|nr:TetR family transcriptional regulator [Microbacterium karelineae]